MTRVENGNVVLPVAQSQQIILGRGVMAELRVVQLEEELRVMRDELAAIKRELELLMAPADDEV